MAAKIVDVTLAKPSELAGQIATLVVAKILCWYPEPGGGTTIRLAGDDNRVIVKETPAVVKSTVVPLLP